MFGQRERNPRCKSCGSDTLPLVWRHFWECWLCYNCTNRRIAFAVEHCLRQIRSEVPGVA